MTRICRRAIALLLLAAAPSPAATVELVPGGRIDEEPVNLVTVTGADGEASALTVTVRRAGKDEQGSPTVVTVHDDHAPITPGRGCAATEAGTVACAAPDELGELRLLLGDGNDSASVRSITADQFIYHTVLDGGPGDDVLTAGDGGELAGGPGDDVLGGSALYEAMDGGAGNDALHGAGHGDFLAGGPGDDDLHGGPGNDDVIGGGGDDELLPAGDDRLHGDGGDDSLDDGDSDAEPAVIGPDLLDGGPGVDAVDSYLRRPTPVTIDLRVPGPAGAAGEDDTILAVEKAFGGDADDTLAGNDADNFLDGRGGNDLVTGADGRDLIFADDADQISGDAGDDDLRTYPQFAGRLRCGTGRDRVRIDVYLAQPADLRGPYVERGCEELSSGTGFVIDPRPTMDTHRRLSFTVLKFRCCRLRLRLGSPFSPFTAFGSASVRSFRVAVSVSRTLAEKIAGDGVVLRASVSPLGAAPFVWRFFAR